MDPIPNGMMNPSEWKGSCRKDGCRSMRKGIWTTFRSVRIRIDRCDDATSRCRSSSRTMNDPRREDRDRRSRTTRRDPRRHRSHSRDLRITSLPPLPKGIDARRVPSSPVRVPLVLSIDPSSSPRSPSGRDSQRKRSNSLSFPPPLRLSLP